MTHSKKQFAALAGTTSRALSIYLKRGKVFLGVDGYDDEHPLNAAFLDHRSRIGVQGKNREPSESKLKTRNEIGSTNPKDREREKHFASMSAMERKHKAIQIEKTQKEVAILDEKKKRLENGTIPYQIAKEIVTRLRREYLFSFKDFYEYQLTLISHKHNIRHEDRVFWVGRINDGLNEAVDRASTAAIKELKNALLAHSERRGPGERKS